MRSEATRAPNTHRCAAKPASVRLQRPECSAPRAQSPPAASHPEQNRHACLAVHRVRRHAAGFFLPSRRNWRPSGGKASSIPRCSRAAEAARHALSYSHHSPKTWEEFVPCPFRCRAAQGGWVEILVARKPRSQPNRLRDDEAALLRTSVVGMRVVDSVVERVAAFLANADRPLLRESNGCFPNRNRPRRMAVWTADPRGHHG
jgi:hypothetical protein